MTYYFRYYPLTIITIIVIFYLSFFSPPKTSLDEIRFIDKIVHTCMYGGVTFLIWLEYLRANKSINKKKIFICGFILPILMGGLIEIMQEYLTTYRSGDWFDFMFNSLGVILGNLIGIYILRPLICKKR